MTPRLVPLKSSRMSPFRPREPIVGGWFKQGDLGFIYGARGLGKTWLAMLLARKCVEGGSVADWNVHKPRGVLYVDGEMPLDGIRERDAALSTVAANGMFYLQHEALFHLTGQVLNLTNPTAQAAILEKCQRDGIEILFLDNLSCLFSGIKENDADAWERVLPWLLDFAGVGSRWYSSRTPGAMASCAARRGVKMRRFGLSTCQRQRTRAKSRPARSLWRGL